MLTSTAQRRCRSRSPAAARRCRPIPPAASSASPSWTCAASCRRSRTKSPNFVSVRERNPTPLHIQTAPIPLSTPVRPPSTHRNSPCWNRSPVIVVVANHLNAVAGAVVLMPDIAGAQHMHAGRLLPRRPAVCIVDRRWRGAVVVAERPHGADVTAAGATIRIVVARIQRRESSAARRWQTCDRYCRKSTAPVNVPCPANPPGLPRCQPSEYRPNSPHPA